MPFKYSKLTDESPSFFFIVILGILENFAILRQYKPGAAAGGGDSAYAKKFPSTLK